MNDPHNYERRLMKALENLHKSNLTKRNKELISQFKDECLLSISVGRTLRYVQILTRIAQRLDKDFDTAEDDDLKKIVAWLNKSDYSPWTKQFYKISIRKFYSWLKKEEKPELTSWINLSMKINQQKMPEDLLSVEEVERLINALDMPKDRAFIAMLYESGCRVGELLMLRIKDVKFDQHGAKISVSGKTGPRRIRIVTSATYLSEWINKHPEKNNGDAPVWIKAKGTGNLWYGWTRILIDKCKTRAGITKRVYPHLFRHSRATHLANHLTEAQMKEFFGWTQSSSMASVYVHLSGRDVDNALLKTYGIDIGNGDEEKEKFMVKNCMRCEEVNPPTNIYCSRCSLPLDKDNLLNLIAKGTERARPDNILDRLMEDKEFRGFMEMKIKALA